jgi:hypothetical protein
MDLLSIWQLGHILQRLTNCLNSLTSATTARICGHYIRREPLNQWLAIPQAVPELLRSLRIQRLAMYTAEGGYKDLGVMRVQQFPPFGRFRAKERSRSKCFEIGIALRQFT